MQGTHPLQSPLLGKGYSGWVFIRAEDADIGRIERTSLHMYNLTISVQNALVHHLRQCRVR